MTDQVNRLNFTNMAPQLREVLPDNSQVTLPLPNGMGTHQSFSLNCTAASSSNQLFSTSIAPVIPVDRLKIIEKELFQIKIDLFVMRKMNQTLTKIIELQKKIMCSLQKSETSDELQRQQLHLASIPNQEFDADLVQYTNPFLCRTNPSSSRITYPDTNSGETTDREVLDNNQPAAFSVTMHGAVIRDVASARDSATGSLSRKRKEAPSLTLGSEDPAIHTNKKQKNHQDNSPLISSSSSFLADSLAPQFGHLSAERSIPLKLAAEKDAVPLIGNLLLHNQDSNDFPGLFF